MSDSNVMGYSHLHLKPLSRGGYEVWADRTLLGVGRPLYEWLPRHAELRAACEELAGALGAAGDERPDHLPVQAEPVLTLPCRVSLIGQGVVLAEAITVEGSRMALTFAPSASPTYEVTLWR